MLWAFKGIVKHEGDEDANAAGDADVCDVKDREVDEVKAYEVNNITRDEAIYRVANPPCCNYGNRSEHDWGWEEKSLWRCALRCAVVRVSWL